MILGLDFRVQGCTGKVATGLRVWGSPKSLQALVLGFASAKGRIQTEQSKSN